MKKIVLWWNSARATLFSSVVLFLSVTMVLFIFSDACAEYRYKAIGYERAKDAFEGRGIFFLDSSYGDFRSEYTVEDVLDRVALLDKFRKNPAVSAVYTEESFTAVPDSSADGSGFVVYCYSAPMTELCPELSRGEWFDEPVNADGSINAVVCGTDYWDVPIGTKIFAEVEGSEVVFRVCGVLYVPTLVPRFGSYASKMSMDSIYRDEQCFVVGECEQTENLILEAPGETAYNSFFLEFESDAPEEEINAVLSELTTRGGYQEMSDILITTKEQLQSSFLVGMMTPLFLLGIAFISYFSISILSVQRRLYSYSVYYLLGYCKRRMILSTALHLLCILIPGVLLNVWYTLSYRTWVMEGILELERGSVSLYFDSLSPWFVVGVAAFLFVITLAACLGLLHKKSPADVWRRSKE